MNRNLHFSIGLEIRILFARLIYVETDNENLRHAKMFK